MREVWAVPGYARWLVGRMVSLLGDQVLALVLGIWVKTLTGSSSLAGLTFFFYLLPQIAAPAFGFLIDRWSRRWVLAVGGLFSALVMLPLFVVRDAGHVWLVWVVTVLYGVSGAVLPSASQAMMRSLVPDDLLGDANASVQVVATVLMLAGPAVGAALFAWRGAWLPATIAIVAFLVSAVVFATFRRDEVVAATERDHGLWAEISAGARHLWRTRILTHVLIGVLIAQSVAGFIEGSLYSVTDEFGRSPSWVGLIVTVQALGMLIGALVSGRLIRRVGEVPAMAGGLALAAASLVVAAVAPTLWVLVACFATAGVGISPLQVGFATLLQRHTPAGLMGRLTTATVPLLAAVSVASMAVGAVLVSFWTFREIYFVIAPGIALAAVYLWVFARRAVPPVVVGAFPADELSSRP